MSISRVLGIIVVTSGLVLVSGFFSGCSKNKGQSVEGDGTGVGLSDEDLALQNQKRWGDGANIPNAMADGPYKDIHFEFDSSTVPSEYHGMLKQLAEELRTDTGLKVEVEGHCDSRGTNEYNMALGERRARAVARMLYDFGAPSAQLSTVSYGEELPLVQGNSEDAWASNRRAHFALNKRSAN